MVDKDKLEVTEYFNNNGFERWNKIYSESDEVNGVQRDIRTGHGQTIEKVMCEHKNKHARTVCKVLWCARFLDTMYIFVQDLTPLACGQQRYRDMHVAFVAHVHMSSSGDSLPLGFVYESGTHNCSTVLLVLQTVELRPNFCRYQVPQFDDCDGKLLVNHGLSGRTGALEASNETIFMKIPRWLPLCSFLSPVRVRYYNG